MIRKKVRARIREKAAQKFWEMCEKNIGPDGPDIYKKNYQVKYCVGCELEKTESELVDGACPIHPNLKIELINEENYFFRWSRYQKPLLDMYAARPDFVVPSFRFNEIKKFVESGLEDFSISRLKEKMPWGIEVPGDPKHVMYVWFDALINYVSTLGWPENEADFEKFWGTKDAPNALQMAGKDQIRQQSAMWQAMLMSAGLPPTRQILIHGFINVGGQKMSKSLGNVIDPYAIVEEYGTDALRYFLARHIHPFEDSDFTMEKFKNAYNADLANGLGNFVARVMALSQKYLEKPELPDMSVYTEEEYIKDYKKAMDNFELSKGIERLWVRIQELDKVISVKEPFKIIKIDPKLGKDLIILYVRDVAAIGYLLEPFMPKTSELIIEAVRNNKKPDNLFPRKD